MMDPILDPRLLRELQKLDPSIPFRCSNSHLHHTWAKTFYSRPELYLQPQSVPEIQRIVTLARKCRRRLLTVGFGHSPSDLTCTSSWMVNLDKFIQIVASDPSTGLVTFQSGISLHDLGLELAKIGLTMPNLGSIDHQSVAGAISTGTHGSSLQRGLLSQSITGISLVLANSHVVRCSATNNPSLFRAALLSLGALGIITEITFRAVPDFNISWSQSLHPLTDVYSTWSSTLWSSAEFTRVWWMPYLKRAVIWRAHKVESDEPLRPPNTTYYGGRMGYYTYHNLLYLCQYLPRLLPWVEWFVFGMQYGFKPGSFTMSAVQPARQGLLMDCLYSQFVNEWALPLEKGPEAMTRLSAWFHGDEKGSRIPFSSEGLWVHSPIEVRVSDTTPDKNESEVRPYLDPTNRDGPTLYLNATLYRPYHRDPPCRARYYEAFEWLMRDLGGRPHWAKNFTEESSRAIREGKGMYEGPDAMDDYLRVRNDSDPDGMFLGQWHLRNLPVGDAYLSDTSIAEKERGRRKVGLAGEGDGLEWTGEPPLDREFWDVEDEIEGWRKLRHGGTGGSDSPDSPITATSDESFDYLARGEASVYFAVAK